MAAKDTASRGRPPGFSAPGSRAIICRRAAVGRTPLWGDDVRHRKDGRAAHALQRLHDVCLVRASAHLSQKPWLIAALASWGIALFEYLLQVPANRIGYTELRLGQLKIVQEVIALAVFVPFAAFYMKQPVSLNYVWAGLCLCGAVFFVFRG
jgi:uncharacterized protein (DUF486 family)